MLGRPVTPMNEQHDGTCVGCAAILAPAISDRPSAPAPAAAAAAAASSAPCMAVAANSLLGKALFLECPLEAGEPNSNTDDVPERDTSIRNFARQMAFKNSTMCWAWPVTSSSVSWFSPSTTLVAHGAVASHSTTSGMHKHVTRWQVPRRGMPAVRVACNHKAQRLRISFGWGLVQHRTPGITEAGR